jgi:L-lactate dehydrogenase complex protein LldE
VRTVRQRTFELVEFLHDIQKVEAFPWAHFPHRVGLHNSCGTLRRLKHAKPSELREPFFSKPLDLLSKVKGIQFVTPARPDECCGFGGTFSVFEGNRLDQDGLRQSGRSRPRWGGIHRVSR